MWDVDVCYSLIMRVWFIKMEKITCKLVLSFFHPGRQLWWDSKDKKQP